MDRVGQEHEVAVDVGVDEAGDDVAPRRRRAHAALARRRAGRLGDHRLEQGHVGPKRRPAGAVDHPAALQDQVECHRSLRSPSRTRMLGRTDLTVRLRFEAGRPAETRDSGVFGVSAPFQRYQLAMVRYGRQCSARAWQSRGLGQLGQAVAVSQADPHAQVARGQDVGPVEREDQEHLGRPDADPLDRGERLGDRLRRPRSRRTRRAGPARRRRPRPG